MPISGRLVPELSMISNQVTDWICNTNRRKVSPWNYGVLNPPLIATYEDADNSKGAALDNCFCFIDKTVWPISWPMSNQWVVYNGHKRMHAFKFQAVTLPNRLIANMKEHSYVSFHLSILKLAALTIFKITSFTTFPHIKKIYIKDPSDRCWKYLISSTPITLVIKLISGRNFLLCIPSGENELLKILSSTYISVSFFSTTSLWKMDIREISSAFHSNGWIKLLNWWIISGLVKDTGVQIGTVEDNPLF